MVNANVDKPNQYVDLYCSLSWLCYPVECWSQTAEADEVQQVQPPKVKPSEDEKKPDLTAAVKLILDETNAFRAKEGKQPVKINDRLMKTTCNISPITWPAPTGMDTRRTGESPSDRAGLSTSMITASSSRTSRLI